MRAVVLFALCLLSLPTLLTAQSRLERYFLLLPNEAFVEELTIAQRKELLAAYRANPEAPKMVAYQRIESFLPSNGFCSILGGFEGDWTMCYWATSKQEYIVAVAMTGCGPVCYMAYFQFFKDVGGSLQPIERPFDKLTVADFYDVSKLSRAEWEALEASMPDVLYNLPREGTDIAVDPQFEYMENENPKATRQRVVLRWRDGRFVPQIYDWEDK